MTDPRALAACEVLTAINAAAFVMRPELFVVIANFPSKRTAHWLKLLQARAIENQACVAGVNRCGDSPSHAYCGRSLIIDPLPSFGGQYGRGITFIDQLNRKRKPPM